VTFEDVGQGLSDDSFFNGGPDDSTEPWYSAGVEFENIFTNFGGGFTGWEGWAYSNVRDIVTAGFENQYAAYSATGNAAGFGSGNSRTYAVGFPGTVRNSNASVLSLPGAASLTSVDVTNTTYALLAFRDGDDGGANFVTQFQDGDFLRLEITGYEQVGANGMETGSLTVDLANYGQAGSEDDRIITDWTTIDLSQLGEARSLSFSLDSNVIDTFGETDFLNTPAYFAIDNLRFEVVPEPSATLAFLCSWAILSRYRRSVGRP
jgi:hypothetical protein